MTLILRESSFSSSATEDELSPGFFDDDDLADRTDPEVPVREGGFDLFCVPGRTEDLAVFCRVP